MRGKRPSSLHFTIPHIPLSGRRIERAKRAFLGIEPALMDLFQIIVLAIVQGLTEFLPVSSSGHVVVTEALFEAATGNNLEDLLEVNIVLHLGTLLAILVYYCREILRLLGEDRRVAGLLIAGTIPAAIFGIGMEKFGEAVLESPMVASALLPVTGLMLLIAVRIPPGSGQYRDLTFGRVLLIGLFQAVAVLPGISRSGATIFGGLCVGLERKQAATFAFLLAIPAIGGAGLLKAIEAFSRSEPGNTSPGILAIGALVAFVVGLFSLWWLIRLVERGHWHRFAWWCIPVGLVSLVWLLSR
jgi:undecaprenyl-diphosphatase